MPVLALDTATRIQSVAIASGGRVVAEAGHELPAPHSETLLRTVSGVLAAAGLRPCELSAVAVTSGPGSFTGLRVGMATAKGLALSAGLPLAGFSTLRILAEGLAETRPAGHAFTVCSLMDAGRGQVYRGIFQATPLPSGGWDLELVGAESACAPEEALAGAGPGSIVGGDGAARYRDRLASRLPEGVLIAEGAFFLAPRLARLAESLERSGRLRAHPLVPNYVRPPDALRGGAA